MTVRQWIHLYGRLAVLAFVLTALVFAAVDRDWVGVGLLAVAALLWLAVPYWLPPQTKRVVDRGCDTTRS